MAGLWPKMQGAAEAGISTVLMPTKNVEEWEKMKAEKPQGKEQEIKVKAIANIDDLVAEIIEPPSPAAHGDEEKGGPMCLAAPTDPSFMYDLDDGCHLGMAYALTFLSVKGAVFAYRQRVEVVGLPFLVAPTVTGYVSDAIHSIVQFTAQSLHMYGASRLGKANLRLDLGEKFATTMIHYDLAPESAESTEFHLGCAIFLAAISMVTGWIMDPQVREASTCHWTGLLTIFLAHLHLPWSGSRCHHPQPPCYIIASCRLQLGGCMCSGRSGAKRGWMVTWCV